MINIVQLVVLIHMMFDDSSVQEKLIKLIPIFGRIRGEDILKCFENVAEIVFPFWILFFVRPIGLHDTLVPKINLYFCITGPKAFHYLHRLTKKNPPTSFMCRSLIHIMLWKPFLRLLNLYKEVLFEGG